MINQSHWKCPVCGGELVPLPEEKRLACRGPRCHSFDIARQGYVNLLLPQKKGASDPGDSKLMVRSRTAFLEKGCYAPFADALCCLCAALCGFDADTPLSSGTDNPLPAGTDNPLPAGSADGSTSLPNASAAQPAPLIADAGCGEGYYTRRLARALPGCDIRGFDLARDGVAHAASSARAEGLANASFAVASLFEMPLADACAAGVVCLFAPVAEEEFARILAPGGFLILGVPGEDHLLGLKAALYRDPYLNPLRRDALSLFEPVGVRRVRYTLTLTEPEDMQNLFRMTPYYWKTSREDAGRLASLTKLETPVCFDLLVYRKK